MTIRETTTAPQPAWDIHSALDQIKSCGFECEAGPLENNVAWRWLASETYRGYDRPQFFVGQSCWIEVEGVIGCETIKRWQNYTIVACRLSSNCDRQIYEYDLSNDPPQPWHYGTGPQIKGVKEERLRSTKP